MCGRWDSEARALRELELTRASAGLITRSSLTTAAGMDRTPITITTGMTPFTTALEILAETIRLSLATTLVMARTRSAPQLATMEWVTRSVWRRRQNGSAAVTWTKVMARRRGTSSAWNGFLPLPPWGGATGTH